MNFILRLAAFLVIIFSSQSAWAQTALCFGDGTGTACPCANSGAAGNGCANSVNPNGANLAATGTASVGADTLLLTGTGMPNGPALYFQGTATAAGGLGVAFNDGLLCAAGTIVRLDVEFNTGGGSSYPGIGDPSISVKGSVVVGNVRYYQLYYRDSSVAFCPPSTSNTTEVICVTWGP